ncbi:LysM peptidoglycan-binding domain-containing protein [Persicobacter diffluens]|uniref:LysM domain-containing protein n=1 Tax=Persicobacter diffluens TaxID=981 RepID=A0AAN4W413_9BACT|nr:hypothetical protein PEDI_54050 [Persicobacter diffluens]
MSTKQDVLHNSPQIRQNQEPQRQSFQDYQEMQQSEEAKLQDFRAELAAHKSGKPNKAGAEVPLAERDAAYYQRYPLEEIKDFYMGSPESRAQVLKAKGIEIPELPHTPITPVEERREDLVAVAQELVQEKQTPNTYEVQAGDCLEVIAAKFGVAVSALKAENADALQQWGNIEGFNAGATIEIPKTTAKDQGEEEAPKLSEVVKEPQAKSKKEEKAEDMKMLIGDQSVGDFTNLVEGDDNPDSLYFSRKAHWPGKKSGVTIGRGYDLGHRGTSTLIENEFKQAGIAISPWKSAIGLRGLGAKNWLEGNAAKLPIISHPQQNALFQLAFAEKKADAKRMATKADVTAKYGATDWEKLNPMIKEMLFDLTYRGDYERDTREFLQPHVVKNDLEGFTKEMKNRSRWLKVSDDRFDQRVAFLEGRVKGLEISKDKTEEKAGTESAAKKAATPTISAGVGSGSAANNKADVLLIQARLHALGLLSPTAYADEKAKAEAVETAVDQKDLKATIDAIYKFQQQVLHWSSSDGNIGGASSKTLAELNGTSCTAEYVKQRIEQYPQVKADREAKAAAEAKRKAEEAEAKRVALEKQKAEEERKEQMRKEPVENAKTYISNYGSDILALADAMKPYVGLNPQLVGAVLGKLGRMTRDNFTYALMNRLSDTELRNGGPELLGQMKSSLEAWFVSTADYSQNIALLNKILGISNETATEQKKKRGDDINPNAPIRESVGKGGVNKAGDVRVIQKNLIILGYLTESEETKSVKKMADDEIVTQLSNTNQAIERYQQFGLGANPDGKVSPGANTYKNMVARLTLIKEYMSHDIETTSIDPVLENSEWISQFNDNVTGVGRGLKDSEKARIDKDNNYCCWDAACAMVKQKGGDLNHIVSSRLPTLLQQNEQDILLNKQAELGVKYIDKQLLAGKPVMIGVDDGKYKTLNADKTTEHFIVIIAKVVKNNSVFYRFFDPGSRYGEIRGYNQENLLLLGDKYDLVGKSPDKSKEYTLSQVRQNK